MPIFIGDITEELYTPSDAKHIKHSCETAALSHGDVVEFFGHVLKWDSDCVTGEFCSRLQAEGDPSCDAALLELFSRSSDSVGKDLYETLESYAQTHSEENAASEFMREMRSDPPACLQVSEEEIQLGRKLFLDHAAQIMQALLHYSLAGGFASARIVRTLRAVSYLVPNNGATNVSAASDDRTFSRLMETFQFVLDVMGCPPYPLPSPSPTSDADHSDKQPYPGTAAYLMPGGDGWKSILRVRMLHGVARRRARERFQKANIFDIPISQEEMSATLGSFCIVPLWCLRRLGLDPPPREAEAFLALWRHIGFYLGVSPEILTRYFSSVRTADKFLASVVLDLFSADDPIDVLSIPTIPILRAVSNKPPSHSSFEYNCAVTRYFIGTELAAHLGLPPTSVRTSLIMHATFLLYKLPVWFARWYPRTAWAAKRRECLSEGMARSVRWSLGMRRPHFRPRTEGGADLADGVNDMEAVVPDFAGGRVLVKKWREMLVEMVGVCTVFGSVVVGSVAILIMQR